MVDRVFIAHRSSDEATAASLADVLREHGFDVRVDREVLQDWLTTQPTGSSFNRALETELAACDAFVVFADPQPDRWQEQEVGAAIRRAWESEDFRIVPISQPGESLPGALASHQAVELAGDAAEPTWQREVVQALAAEPDAGSAVDPKSWPEETQSSYRRRLKKISEMAKDDEADQQDPETRLSSWFT